MAKALELGRKGLWEQQNPEGGCGWRAGCKEAGTSPNTVAGTRPHRSSFGTTLELLMPKPETLSPWTQGTETLNPVLDTPAHRNPTAQIVAKLTYLGNHSWLNPEP